MSGFIHTFFYIIAHTKCKNMLEYDRIDISEGIDTTQNKLVSKECSFCHFLYFIDKNFNYKKYLCDGCHDILMKAMSIKDLIIVYANGNAYRVNFSFMSAKEASGLIRNSNLVNKKGLL